MLRNRTGIGVIWDNDGVLTHFHDIHEALFIAAYAACGHHLPPDICWRGLGIPLDRCYELWNSALGLTDMPPFHEWEQRVDQLLPDFEEPAFARGLAEDLVELLEHLALYQVPMAILTSNVRRHVLRRFHRLGLFKWFSPERIITLCDLNGTPPKPDPAPFRIAADQIGVPPHRCIVIGDAPTDIDGGIAAGMKTIAFTRYTRSARVDHADFCTDSFRNLAIPRLRALVQLHPTAW